MSRRRTPRTNALRFVTGRSARTLSHPYALHPPVLGLDFGAVSVLITTDSVITTADLCFARQLARQAALYVLALERHLSATRKESAA
ncbi:hypothetical protein ACIBG7_06015 [Nonomuraea sp. NPDC050328]|uniref:hypothetical protein n=1 Tax=Nonomuraea sp. NPDC050328 TaxID=3364361 RepID=UPI00378F48C1